ncbi:MAG: hypothetical protein ACTHMD_16750 [Flavisolibacter sp.]
MILVAYIKKLFALLLFVSVMGAVGCQKKDYFSDTGTHSPNFQGNVLQYLKSKPGMFDSVARIIHLAGMDEVFEKEDITFFAPADSSIRATLNFLNIVLSSLGQKEVRSMDQIKPEVWRAQLSRYLFKGKKSMNDFPQLDPSNVSAYPGRIYTSYDGEIMNIGVIYNDAGGVKYAGYRQLLLSYIPSQSTPLDYQSWYPVYVASVNIAPTNGYVHALRFSNHVFGFEINQFIENAIAKGID